MFSRQSFFSLAHRGAAAGDCTEAQPASALNTHTDPRHRRLISDSSPAHNRSRLRPVISHPAHVTSCFFSNLKLSPTWSRLVCRSQVVEGSWFPVTHLKTSGKTEAQTPRHLSARARSTACRAPPHLHLTPDVTHSAFSLIDKACSQSSGALLAYRDRVGRFNAM